jgi:hypothetical protein
VKYYNDKEFPFGKGNKLIPCLMDYRLQLEEKADKPCRAFLTDVSRVIFGDFRLICNFVEHCRNDIEMYKCGRETFGQETEWSEEHSQGEVVHCLEEHMAEDQNSISKECVTELVNLAELRLIRRKFHYFNFSVEISQIQSWLPNWYKYRPQNFVPVREPPYIFL